MLFSGLRKLIFGIPELGRGLTGLVLGPPRLKTCSKPRVFARFYDFRIEPRFALFLFAFSKMLRKPRVFTRFSGLGPAVLCCFFIRFCWLALRKRAENNAFYCVFGVSVITPSFLCFSYMLLLAFLRFLRNVAKTICFHTFFAIWPETLCSIRGTLEANFRRFPSLGAASTASFLTFRCYSSILPARHSSKMSLLGHASEAMLRHFPRPAWFEIFVLRLPKLIWTFPMADPEAHFGHFPRPGSKVIAL